MITYKVTNEAKFDKVIDIDIDVRGNKGVISIDIEGKGWVDFYGEHGKYDFEDEFGFVLIKQSCFGLGKPLLR